MSSLPPSAGGAAHGGDVALHRVHVALLLSILYLPVAVVLHASGAGAVSAFLVTAVAVGAALFSLSKTPILANFADALGRAVARIDQVTDRSKHVLAEVIATTVLLMIGLSLAFSGTSDADSASSGCTAAVRSISASRKVADYSGGLVAGCSSLADLDQAVANTPSEPLSVETLLIFCSPASFAETPTATYNSELCKQARTAGRAGITLTP